VSATISVNKS
jgi:hypothetical protein